MYEDLPAEDTAQARSALRRMAIGLGIAAVGVVGTVWFTVLGAVVAVVGCVMMGWAELDFMASRPARSRAKKGSRGGRH